MTYRIITNLPTVGADNDSWGSELNQAVTELDSGAARVVDVYDRSQADARYIRTVNGVAPDVNGDVAVAGGTGSPATVPNGSVTDSSVAPGGLSPSVITGTAIVNNDSRLTDSRTPKAHRLSHVAGGSDAILPADIGAVATTQIGQAGGVASLGLGGQVPTAQLPALVTPGVTPFRIWIQATAPTTAQGAADGDLWVQTT